MSVTVVIPSYKRAEYLKTALESVKKQTALDAIDQIIVSENSDDEEAAQVCMQFPELKITFIQQDTSFTAVEHLAWIIDQSNSKYTAMLHDDDWWYPTHLENAIKVLEETDNESYFSNFIMTYNEICKAAYFHHPSVFTYLCGDRFAFDIISLTIKEIATLTYLYTPFHMSTMVAVTSTLQKASNDGLKQAKPYYADRILYPYLSFRGNIAFNPLVLCAVRQHARNDGKTVDSEERIKSHKEGSEKISLLALSKDIDVVEEWEGIKRKVNAKEWEEVSEMYSSYFNEKDNLVFSSKKSAEPQAQSGNVDSRPSLLLIKKFLRNIVPYGVINRYQQTKRKTAT